MTRSGPPVPESIASDLIPQTFAKERTPYSQCPESIAYQPFAEKGMFYGFTLIYCIYYVLNIILLN